MHKIIIWCVSSLAKRKRGRRGRGKRHRRINAFARIVLLDFMFMNMALVSGKVREKNVSPHLNDNSCSVQSECCQMISFFSQILSYRISPHLKKKIVSYHHLHHLLLLLLNHSRTTTSVVSEPSAFCPY